MFGRQQFTKRDCTRLLPQHQDGSGTWRRRPSLCPWKYLLTSPSWLPARPCCCSQNGWCLSHSSPPHTHTHPPHTPTQQSTRLQPGWLKGHKLELAKSKKFSDNIFWPFPIRWQWDESCCHTYGFLATILFTQSLISLQNLHRAAVWIVLKSHSNMWSGMTSPPMETHTQNHHSFGELGWLLWSPYHVRLTAFTGSAENWVAVMMFELWYPG